MRRDTRNLILDAGETLFAEHGLEGSTIRDIALEAEVRPGNIHYYFSTKEELFIAVINRRWAEWTEVVSNAIRSTGESDDIADILKTFLAVVFEYMNHKGGGWRDYLRLLARGMSNYDITEIHPALLKLGSITDLLRARIAAALGISDLERLDVPMYLITSSIIYITQDQGLLDEQTQGRQSVSRIDRTIDAIAAFWAAGIGAKRP